MDVDHVSYLFKQAFKDKKPDANGQTVTSMRAPRTHHRDDPDAYKTSADMTTFEVRHSMIRGDGLLAAPAFVCFPNKLAQARYVDANPGLYSEKFVNSCRNTLRVCSSEVLEPSSSRESALTSLGAPESQTQTDPSAL